MCAKNCGPSPIIHAKSLTKKLCQHITFPSWPGIKTLLRSKRLANDRGSIESKGYAFSGPAQMTMKTKRVMGITWGLNNLGLLDKLRLGLACSVSSIRILSSSSGMTWNHRSC